MSLFQTFSAEENNVQNVPEFLKIEIKGDGKVYEGCKKVPLELASKNKKKSRKLVNLIKRVKEYKKAAERVGRRPKVYLFLSKGFNDQDCADVLSSIGEAGIHVVPIVKIDEQVEP